MNTKTLAIAALAIAGLSACEMTAMSTGFGDTAPMLVDSGNGLSWSNAAAFAPVPESEAARGAAICAAVPTTGGTARAVGYHPAALDQNGNLVPGGGFLCG